MPPTLGIIAITLFYLVFLVVGAWAGRRQRDASVDSLMLASRSLPLWLGTLTLIATWVGGGYINGTAEAVYNSEMGLVWTQAPWCYALSLVVGGLVFAGRMRSLGFTTLLDVFQRRYGRRMAAVLYLPALFADACWMAAILAALGRTFAVMFDLSPTVGILVSAAVAMIYTCWGGLWSVAFTDALQLACVMLGLCVAIPFAATAGGGIVEVWSTYHDQFAESARWVPPASAWSGETRWGWQWLDIALLLVLGGIPWQVYFQRVLACPTPATARRLSILAGFGCLLMAGPPVLIGMIGATADWSAAGVPPPADATMVLPHVLRHLTPTWVAVLGLSAVAAAVMSSIDSSLLSSATMFAWNVYAALIRPLAGARELRNVTRCAVVLIGLGATWLALSVQSIYALWYLCSDVVYVVLFPQLVSALFWRRANTVGAVGGMIVGLGIRMVFGIPALGIPSAMARLVPGWAGLETWPYRTTAMLASLLTIYVVSRITSRWVSPLPIEVGG